MQLIEICQSNEKMTSQSYCPVAADDNDFLDDYSLERIKSISWKVPWSKIILIIAIACSSFIFSISFLHVHPYQPTLHFRQKNNTWKFKIVQITDIHLGEEPATDWGPEQDRRTWLVLDQVLKYEKPDFIILSGDQVTTNYFLPNTTAYYNLLGEFLSTYETPWATIFGNHDDNVEDSRPSGKSKNPPKADRRDLLAADQKFPLSLSKGGPLKVTGTSNYMLDIFIQNNVAAQIFLFDSGGGSLPEAIDDSQIQWFKTQALSSILPAIAFQHIPTLTHAFSETCSGFQGEGIDKLHDDAGVVEALADAGRFLFLAVGHNHGNDYCCPYNDTKLEVCFGRHSGYGGYGKWERGARVYELSIDKDQANNDSSRNIMEWKSWVRLESGLVVDEVSVT
jgi:hypothetical protein